MGEKKPIIQLAKLSSVGLEMGAAVAIGWGIGYWLDKRFKTSPWLMIVFLLFGVAAGFKGLIRVAKAAQREAQKRDEESKS